ncbi:Disease resistance protein [Corchorus olitorius]|uniref:Disease resistance protein n=1 Tax=Corchorus olitorius TaxID=93759 RepID=A0A1R3KFJ4_9ROSI|nr:Disease resistance protein [Corchorus olitorius]
MMLPDICAVLDDAEQRQMKDQPVKKWLADLHDLSYDIDDILDEFAIEALGRKLDQSQAIKSKVKKIFLSPKSFKFNKKMMLKIEEISERVSDLTRRKSVLELKQSYEGATKLKQRLQPTSLVNEPHVYGREKEKADIVENLLKNDDASNKIKLKEKLLGKKLLLVLDDVWNENNVELGILLSPFGVGTKILVTTRSHNVFSIMGTVKARAVQKLSEKDSLFILAQHALKTSDFGGHPELKEIGENIVNKCNGLPLAAKAIGGLLCTSLDPEAWEEISKMGLFASSEWNKSDSEMEIFKNACVPFVSVQGLDDNKAKKEETD